MKREDLRATYSELYEWATGHSSFGTVETMLGDKCGDLRAVLELNQLMTPSGRPTAGVCPADIVKMIILYLAMRRSV